MFTGRFAACYESVNRISAPFGIHNKEFLMDALTPESEWRLRAELEQQIASLKATLENMKAESDRWRTIAERRALPERRTESAPTTRGESREWWWKLMG